MLRHLRPALMMLLFLTLITGVFYPLLVTGISQALFPSKANGSIIEEERQARGLFAHRSAVHLAEVLLEPALGDESVPVQRCSLNRIELWPAEPGIAERDKGPG